MNVYSYILQVDNLRYFTEQLKTIIESTDVNYIKDIKTLDISTPYELTIQQKSDLDDFITNYTNPPYTTIKSTIIVSSSEVSSDIQDWYTILSWEENHSIKHIHYVSKLEPSPDDIMYSDPFQYSVRAVDTTNNTIIGPEQTFTNSVYETNETDIENIRLGLGTVMLELQVKKYIKGSYVYIKSVSTHY